MNWENRIKEARYISPSGIEIPFTFEDVSRSFTKLTQNFEFPGYEGSFIQDLGRSGRRFPFRAIFHGANCDLEANNFEAALGERGIGKLEHPFYGNFNVIPFGAVERSDRLKTAANQSIVTVTFYETGDAVFITNAIEQVPEETAREQGRVSNEQTVFQWAELAGRGRTVAEEESLKDRIIENVNLVRNGIQDVADKTEEVQREFQAIYDSITQGIDDLIGKPLTIGFQILSLAQSPARAFDLIRNKFNAYGNLLEDIVSRTFEFFEFGNEENDNFIASDLSANSVVSGAGFAAINTVTPDNQTVSGEVLTQRIAIEAAETLANYFDQWVDWREQQFENLQLIDTGEAHQALQQFIALCQSYLINVSFDLPRERTVTLDRPRNIIEFVAEVYGEVDQRLDQFITQNELTGDELIELPEGKAVTYYAD